MEKSNKLIKELLKKNPSLIELSVQIQKDLAAVEKQLQLFVDSPNEIVSEISSYVFQKAGKRIRPILLLLCSKLYGYTGDENIFMSALVETIHTASLIHDDIIDNSDTRRGKATVHSRWGPNITVLLGDYLYIKALGSSLQSQHREIVEILMDVSAHMIEGELNEYAVSGHLNLEEKVYLDNLDKKTASLFSASCRIGGILGGASPKEADLLSDYGSTLGMSFQIIDDLLDYTGDKKTLGKPTLSDLKEGRITLPLIYTWQKTSAIERNRIQDMFEQKGLKESAAHEILDIVRSNGALDYTYQRAVDFSKKSQSLLQQLPPSACRDSLLLISEYVVNRDR
jgi:octaprenyl-diphosphate synthase